MATVLLVLAQTGTRSGAAVFAALDIDKVYDPVDHRTMGVVGKHLGISNNPCWQLLVRSWDMDEIGGYTEA